MILIINTLKRKAQAISDIFHYMGVLSYPSTPREALTEIEGAYRAALIIEPEQLADAEAFVTKLRSYNSKTPIFAVTSAPMSSALSDVFDGKFAGDVYSSRLLEEIIRYQNDRGLPTTAQYTMRGIDASCGIESVQVFDKPIDFTKTETMILRYLIATYPIPQDAKSILRYAFKPLRKPEEASIRTHVSVMNKKFREVRGSNLFSAIPNKGYVVLTPETIAKEQLINV